MTPVLHYYDTPDGITAFTTTRHGGYSKGNCSELNINPHRGDDPVAVQKNLEAVAKAIGVDANRVVRQHQVHETEFRKITDDTFKMSPSDLEEHLEGVDCVGTDMKKVCIGVFTADCIPVVFYDTEHHAIAAAHAGWRGTEKRIVRKTVENMKACFGTCPEALHAIIGPGITLKNFEVGQEVYDLFAEAGFDMRPIASKYPTNNPKPGDPAEKWHIDLPECNRLQLIAEGVRPENIFMSGIDTYDEHDDYFSSRRLHTGFGTMFTGIMIR